MIFFLHLLLRMNGMLGFICMGPVEQQGTRCKRKLQDGNFLSTTRLEPRPDTALILSYLFYDCFVATLNVIVPLKLFRGYKFSRPCLINRIWGLKQE